MRDEITRHTRAPTRRALAGQDQADFKTGLNLGFIVQSASKRAGEPPYRLTKATKKEALDAAIGFMAQGMEDVTITDEKGQVYSTSEFVDFIEDAPGP
jgi:hypothetical protein